eukprot:8145437-Pyramimonas_sp.AAC.1
MRSEQPNVAVSLPGLFHSKFGTSRSSPPSLQRQLSSVLVWVVIVLLLMPFQYVSGCTRPL